MKTKLLSALVLVLLANFCTAQNQWLPLSSGTTKNLRDVFFTSRDTGYVIGEDSTVLKTVNGGNTWTALPKPALQAPGTLQAIWMWPNGSGFLTADFINDICTPRTAARAGHP